MASWSWLAISAASDSATPNTNDQVRRRLTWSSCGLARFGGLGGGEAARQFAYHAGALDSAHCGPARNFVNSAAATQAQPGTGVERTDIDARALDHSPSRGPNRLRP